MHVTSSFMKPALVTLLVLHLLFSVSVSAQVKLPQIISDGLIMQREQNNKIWGWASPEEKISLYFRGHKYKTIADDAGNWEIILPPQAAGGPYDLILSGNNEMIIRDVLFGDVWLCTGQSNMVLPMERVKEKYPDEIANA